MRLSDLVNYYNQLCATTTNEVKKTTEKVIENIIYLTKDPLLADKQLEILKAFDNFEIVFDDIKKKTFNQIRVQERSYIENSYQHYEQTQLFKNEWFTLELPVQRPNYLREQYEKQDRVLKQIVQTSLDSKLPISPAGQTLVTNRIARYSGWKHPAAILHPGQEPWIHSMVANDPLYLIDEHYELLDPVIKQFNSEYRNRLRVYIINEYQQQEILWQLPNDQIGLMLVWNYFNNKPLEMIKKYLTEIFNKLKPGGILLMSYNDCDRWPGVVAVETGTALYTPGVLIQSFAEMLGFETVYTWHENGPWSLLELRKPGKNTTLRGGQALAKIIPKAIAKSK